MKRVITIIVLIVFTYSFLGVGFVYNVWLYSVKQHVKEKLESKFPEESKIIKIPKGWEYDPPPEFKWHEEHEFRYRGQMYDVIRKELHGDQIWYYCYWDKAETKLLNHLSEYVASYLTQKPDRKKEKTNLQLVLEKTFLLPLNKPDLKLPLSKQPFISQSRKLLNIYLDIDRPPPRPAISV